MATQLRHLRMGAKWDAAAEFAKLNGVTMTDLVNVAIDRLLESPDAADTLRAMRPEPPAD